MKKPKYAKELSENYGWHWTKKEDKLLRKYLGKMPVAKVAQKLGRKVSSVMNRAARLRLSRAFIHSAPQDYSDLLGKKIGNIIPYAIDPNKPIGKPRFLLCKDIRFPDAPPRRIAGTTLRRTDCKWVKRPNGYGHLSPHNGYVTLHLQGKTGLEHRLVMSEHLKKTRGYGLRSNETVHHGLKGRAVNTLDNLEVRRKGNHPAGHGELETAKWLVSLGWKVKAPKRIANGENFG